jgi:hypothetical protein
MSKQIKLGFDKIASTPLESDQVLIDVSGNPLVDKDGNPLYTETTNTPVAFFAQKNATSVHINNRATPVVTAGGSISVREQFAETSQVSTSLLGIPRAETQQTLLADVSVYGIDDNTWEFYRNPAPFQPIEWSTRLNRNYGRRYESRLGEHANEQALALEVFPAPWLFPFGPKWQNQGRYNATLFPLYINFINLGNALYEYYTANNRAVFAETHFLVPEMATIVGAGASADVIYNENFNLAMEYIEQWTMTWMLIRDNKLEDPINEGKLITAVEVNRLFGPVFGFQFSETQPGYSSTLERYCQLQSKEAFRYQPGAISGFTFGIKLNSDPTKTENVIEWGCANDTDQLMFQVKGLRFGIVRRSTVPLTIKNLELAGFKTEDQITVQSPNPFERDDNTYTSTDLGLSPTEIPPLYELVIPKDNFNGDKLDGTGPSGYNISFDTVTMYKIEYSWYGAIGARFYAFIPVGNDEARWVLIHTLVIENTLDEPSLRNPFMHFRYSIYSNDTSSLVAPMFLYKYGASYYIDGNDKGSFTYNSYKLATQKSITSSNSKPLIGFQPKERILNRDGIGTQNQKNFYIESVSLSSSKNARVDILECEGCPGGHGHFYATSLENGQRGVEDQYKITASGLVFVDDEEGTKVFTEQDNNKKIIGPGVFSSYVFSNDEDNTIMDIKRRLGTTRINVPIDEVAYTTDDTIIIDGEETSILPEYEFTGRLTGYDDIIASSTVIRKPKIKVHFLNPIKVESSGHWAEFRIGITPKKPELITPDGESEEVLLFDGAPLEIENEIYGEVSQFQAAKNLQGVDVSEWDPRYGQALTQDPRTRQPLGDSSGRCSELNFEIIDDVIGGVTYTTTDPSGQLSGTNFITFTSEPEIIDLTGGNIGIFDGNKFVDSGITFTGNYEEFINDGLTNYVAPISAAIPSEASIETNGIALRSVRCFGRYVNVRKVFPFSISEYYLFIAMRDNARINNIVVREFDGQSSFAHTPSWIKDDSCLIDIVQIQNQIPPASVLEKLTDSEYIGTDGRFNMGGITFTGDVPANFVEKTRLDSVTFDDQLSLPLRPSFIKTSVYIGENKTETINMNHIFDTNKYKISKGSFNNKYYYISSIVADSANTASIQINVSGKEQ